MDCLLTLCFAANIYLTGAVGVQAEPSFYDIDNSLVTNSYGKRIGSFSAVVEFNNGLFAEYRHVSGLSTWEQDYGLNAVMIGAKIYFLRND